MSRWRNWSGRLTCEPAALHFARSVEDIQALISGSAAAGHKIRPAGAGHSHSPIVLSDEVIVDFSGLSGVVEVDREAKSAWIRAGSPIYTLGAQLHEHVAKLPQEYDTLIGERGLSLSGGQRQRLNISRSLLLGTHILILDDSTSAVDAGTEKKIREALKEGAAERLTIIISHRVASLMHADQIVYMEDGRILERGNHEELIKQGGNYAQLYQLQTLD